MTFRRSATALAASAVLCAVAAPTAFADDASPSASPSVVIPSGLYGKTDPTYDGVWRQSLALLAQHTVGVRPAAKAVDWLTGQQCADGGFASFRADVTKPCDGKVLLDTNATAAAVQALSALGGHDDAVKKGAGWLKSVAGKDGGWSYNPGGASDANSTSVVIGALAAAGEPTAAARKMLVSLSIPCDAKDGGGAFAYQPDKKSGKLYANADASGAAVLGALGLGLAPDPGGKDAGGTGCLNASTPTQAAHNGATYLAGATAGKAYLKSAMPGAEDQPDFGNTADAVTALGADGLPAQAKQSLAWLEQNAGPWAAQAGPAAYAQLIFAAHANGADPRAFGSLDLVEQLNATGPAPVTAKSAENAEKKDSDSSGVSVWWIVGIGLVAGIGIGFLISMRGRKRTS
ncbi:terpene cyclase/mutase family protein [Streptomyces sp. NBC_01267]|uniref:prenyltransferase/squalene oxidase repeat-containing protein n=1 Tax=unclassified Streptomyces TaxID=2593676 RepID=UPI00224E5675|nr:MULTISPECIES: prenyltransferase/squalene oxidase repeat-containing protein [unclassified Streptomyces]MCX4551389.1 terpene cyclase/mutase family protein [Streptomyces sp. NBC_01500]WSV56677.1 terpene cyclase/mutase family protein [Streptomyces sp. NBC_01014]